MNLQIEITKQIFIVADLLEKTGEEIFRRVGLTVRTYQILLKIQTGVKTTSELARCVEGSLASITQKTKVLEKNGFIKRIINPRDKRSWDFLLTKKAEQTLLDATPLFAKAVKVLYEPLSRKDQAQLLQRLIVIEKQLHCAMKDNNLVSQILDS